MKTVSILFSKKKNENDNPSQGKKVTAHAQTHVQLYQLCDNARTYSHTTEVVFLKMVRT